MHKHTCHDCGIVWEHDLEGCLISEEKGQNYPCIGCIRNHVIFVSDTPEGAKDLYENSPN